MAELTKKLNIQKTGSSTVACKIYSTTTEAGDTYMSCTVDGVNGYIPLGTTSDTNATVGRIQKNSTTYAIKSQSKPPYTEQSYTTAGTHTFTVPAGITRLRVAVCGGGGGGCNNYPSNEGSRYGGTGGTSSFGSLIQATGGQGGICKTIYIAFDDASHYSSSASPGSGGTPNGNTVSSSSPTGGGGFALSFTKSSGSYGKGGNSTVMDYNSRAYAPGGSGGYNTNYITVSPGTYNVTVGVGGSANGSNTTAGSSGFVLIAYGGDI